MTKPKSQQFSPEVRERAVRLVPERQGEYETRWAAIRSIAERIGCSAEALRTWLRRAERDAGQRPGLTTDEPTRLKALGRENKALRRAHEMRRVRTTTPDPVAERPRDRVGRDFEASRPNALWVADFTYVAARRASCTSPSSSTRSRAASSAGAPASMRSDLVLGAREQALYDRETDTGAVCHSDRGAHYLSFRYNERLAEAGVETSVGSRGDAYDKAPAESVIGLYKTEVIRHAGPWRGLEDVGFATLEWVA